MALTLLFVASCGPEDSATDKQKRELQEQFEKDVEALRPLVGEYRGSMTTMSGTVYPAGVELHIGRVLRKIPPGDQVVEVSSLLGKIVLYPDDPKQIFSLGEVSSGHYSPDSGLVAMDVNPILGGGSSVRQFSGSYRDGKLSGDLPVNGRINKINVERVAQ